MSGSVVALLAGFGAFVVHALLVPLALRFFRRLAPVLLHFLVGVFVHVVQVLVLFRIAAAWSLESVPYWHAAAVLGAGMIGYLFVFSAIYKSLSLNILRTLILKKEEKGVTLQSLAQDVVVPEVRKRLVLLVEAGFANFEDGFYRTTPKGDKTANRLRWLQRLFGIARSGLY